MIIGKGLYTKKYQIYSPKLPLSFDGFKFIFISDLHGKIYGKENTTLIQLINKANPDCILIGGDMMVGGENQKYEFGYSPISAKSVDISVDLISKLSKKYTIIHALGNHEEKLHSELWRKYTEALKEIGGSDNSKVVLMPLEAGNLIGSIAGITELLKSDKRTN